MKLPLAVICLLLSGCLYVGPRPICFHEPEGYPFENAFPLPMSCGVFFYDWGFHER